MSPFEHGECYVLDDGCECDLDLGNYERFLGVRLTGEHNVTTGKVYREVIGRERRGDYLGKTVQVVPHITDEIQAWIRRAALMPVTEGGPVPDICLIEVGGTVGDIESMVFLEALRQMQHTEGPDSFVLSFVSLVPVMGSEQKTKPTQHGVKTLRSLGLNPTIIFCRSTEELIAPTRKKIAMFTHVDVENVMSVHDVTNIYHVPMLLENQGLLGVLARTLGIEGPAPSAVPHERSMERWNTMAGTVDRLAHAAKAQDGNGVLVKIALIGKYTGFSDSYLSVIKALKHASIEVERELQILWVEASSLLDPVASTSPKDEKQTDDEKAALKKSHEEAWALVKSAHGIIVPGGFGARGVEGKVAALSYAREAKVPCLGVCLGFQSMVVEYCRNVMGMEGANSVEFEAETSHPVVIFMPEIGEEMGGTMRLGSRDTAIGSRWGKEAEGGEMFDEGEHTISYWLYKSHKKVSERHRHRYEVNPKMIEKIEAAGLAFAGRDADTYERMEISELPRSVHPFYMGCQYHPEFKSRPLEPSPPFMGLLLASCGKLDLFLDRAKSKEKIGNGH
eukprot:CAMPEP_0194268204 /NCGR_PEP_ID=MMETSP0169-20130528/2561_1 /TAXON_ID=218684 /ORGANISM="Corethron pennatum, Strain L29A3" /LENGTH=562 /DNA_ID=CAMNT_0039009343 /DNA_START=219 /DNA_END=1907 /DNA_ORIENTATION=+